MFGAGAFLFPGQELREFTVFEPVTTENGYGDIVATSYNKTGVIKAILAAASVDERERWRQMTHEISHKIIVYRAPPFPIIAGDVIGIQGRSFYVQGDYNPGGLGHWLIYYCKERKDIDV